MYGSVELKNADFGYACAHASSGQIYAYRPYKPWSNELYASGSQLLAEYSDLRCTEITRRARSSPLDEIGEHIWCSSCDLQRCRPIFVE